MKHFLLFILFYCQFISAQEEPKISKYNVGHNGMELIIDYKDETIIISTFNSKMTIRQDIARKLFELYRNNQIQNDSKIMVIGDEATVTGNCQIVKKNKLTSVNLYYETVKWNTGLLEIYEKKPLNKT